LVLLWIIRKSNIWRLWCEKKRHLLIKIWLQSIKPSHMTDYMDYNGPWPKILKEFLLILRTQFQNRVLFWPLPSSLAPELGQVYISNVYGQLSYLELYLRTGYSYGVNGTMCYSLSIMGRQNQADNLYLILHNDFSNEISSKPTGNKRYENKRFTCREF